MKTEPIIMIEWRPETGDKRVKPQTKGVYKPMNGGSLPTLSAPGERNQNEQGTVTGLLRDMSANTDYKAVCTLGQLALEINKIQIRAILQGLCSIRPAVWYYQYD